MRIRRRQNFSKRLKPRSQLLKKIADRYFGIAAKYYQERKMNLAIFNYDKSIYFYPKNAAAYLNRGVAYHQNCEFEKAIADYNKAISLSPYFVKAYSNRAITFAFTGEKKMAEQDYLKALSIAPDAAAYSGLGVISYDNKNFLQAIEHFNRAIALNPRKGNYYQSLGNAYFQIGEYEKAVAAYTRSIGLKDSNRFILVSYKGRSKAYEKMGRSLLAAKDKQRYDELYKQLKKRITRRK